MDFTTFALLCAIAYAGYATLMWRSANYKGDGDLRIATKKLEDKAIELQARADRNLSARNQVAHDFVFTMWQHLIAQVSAEPSLVSTGPACGVVYYKGRQIVQFQGDLTKLTDRVTTLHIWFGEAALGEKEMLREPLMDLVYQWSAITEGLRKQVTVRG